MKKILFLAAASLLILSCSKDKETSAPRSGLNIRLSNTSPYDFENITVNTQLEEFTYENLSAGEFSGYQKYQEAYRYSSVNLTINGDTYAVQPIDYFGETLLEEGNYTYALSADLSQGQYGGLSLVLVEE